MVSSQRVPRRRLLFGLLGLIAAMGIDRGLKSYYYARTYRYYDAGEVYWEDSHTLLLFSPDPHLLWRLKPNIRMKLEETPEQYGGYIASSRKEPYAFEVRTNSRGFNSPEFDCSGKGDARRVVTLGDSRTMAEGIPLEGLYSRRLEALLNALPGRRHQVINAGVSGYSSYQGLVVLERELLACAPDVVTVLFGINDQDVDQGISDREKALLFDSSATRLRAWTNRSMIIYALRRGFWRVRAWLLGSTPAEPVYYGDPKARVPRVSLDEYAQNLHRFADLGRRYGFWPVFLVLPTSPYAYEPALFPDEPPLPLEVGRAFDEADGLAARDPKTAVSRLRQLVAEHPRSSRAQHLLARCLRRLGQYEEAHAHAVEMNRSITFSRFEAIVRQIARERGAALVDLTPEFTTLRREPLYVDDMHPSLLGHEIIARRLHEELTRTPSPP
jgi:lysophospholipase L1-like esterase